MIFINLPSDFIVDLNPLLSTFMAVLFVDFNCLFSRSLIGKTKIFLNMNTRSFTYCNSFKNWTTLFGDLKIWDVPRSLRSPTARRKSAKLMRLSIFNCIVLKYFREWCIWIRKTSKTYLRQASASLVTLAGSIGCFLLLRMETIKFLNSLQFRALSLSRSYNLKKMWQLYIWWKVPFLSSEAARTMKSFRTWKYSGIWVRPDFPRD